MKIIIIHETVYQVSEKQYEQIKKVEAEANNLPFGGDMHLEEFLNFNTENYKLVGDIDFEFYQ